MATPGAVTALRKGDVILPAALASTTILEHLALGVGPVWLTALPSWFACLLLVWRRRWPLIVGTAAPLLLLVEQLLGVPRNGPSSPIAIIGLACYTLGRYVPDVKGLLGVGLMQVAFLTELHHLPVASDVAFVGVLTLGPWTFGRVVLGQVRAAEGAALTARRLEEQQGEAAEAAVRAERARIARELHDVIAHTLSVMVIQAGAAESLIRTDPERAVRVTGVIQDAGRRALTEVARLLHLIRADDELVLTPQPGLADLPRLVEEFTDSGLDLRWQVDAAAGDLSPAVDTSLYRIVEEALTNALRHARGGQTRLRLGRRDDQVVVEVASTGGRSPAHPRGAVPSGGHGLAGMRERVSVFGGTLDAGPTADGGYLLRAQLPVKDQP